MKNISKIFTCSSCLIEAVKLKLFFILFLIFVFISTPDTIWALASNNVSLDSNIYLYIDKLVAFGLIKGDIKGIKPYSKSEVVRLLKEAESNLSNVDAGAQIYAERIIKELKELIPREVSLREKPDASPFLDFNPFSSSRYRYVYVNGSPRSFERPVHDPGGDGVFGIGSGLRPDNPYPSPVLQHGTEGTPFFANNNGISYLEGHNTEFLFSSEFYLKSFATALFEPLFINSTFNDSTSLLLNKGYVKLGGSGLELEVGRDENWLGFGYRGNITLTNNARNFDLIKLSSPEPLHLKYIGDIKYSLIFSRFDKTVTNGEERQPYFVAAKVSVKPTENMELGINLGRQQGGPGVNNSIGDNIRGLIGGTNADNSNSVAGVELRIRLPYLRNTEVYGEYSGEDTASFWPIVESYVAGVFIPRLTSDGKNDFRFEYFLGNAILYTNSTFQEGYLYRGMPIGHSQGGATEEFFSRYTHWFSLRNRVAIEYVHSERGNLGRVKVNSSGVFDQNGDFQRVERRNAGRVLWTLPLNSNSDIGLMYGYEHINNFNLVSDRNQINQVFNIDITYRY